MKPLTDAIPDAHIVIDLEPARLGHHVLVCLSGTTETNIERAIIARTLSADYHQSFRSEITAAIDKSLDWLLSQCLLGATPYDQLFLTLAGQDAAALYADEIAYDV